MPPLPDDPTDPADPVAATEPEMPPDTENQLLALLDRHLRSTEQTIARLEARVDALGTRFDTAINDIRKDMTRDARLQIYVQLLLVLTVAALGGANLYVQAARPGASVTVGTGTAATAAP